MLKEAIFFPQKKHDVKTPCLLNPKTVMVLPTHESRTQSSTSTESKTVCVLTIDARQKQMFS